MIHKGSIRRWLLFSVPFVFLVLFYFYPLGKIISYSFLSEGFWNSEKIERLFNSPVYVKIIWFTIWQAGLSTIITMVLALPGAYIFAHFRFPGKDLIQALMTIPFVLPTVVTAAAFRALLGTNGLLNSWLENVFDLSIPPIRIDQTIYFFLLAHVFYNYTLVMRIVSSYWASLSPDLRAAAAVLGASPWQIFRKITLPLLMPAIGSAALLVFIFCFTSFGIILILGGPGYATIEVEIYRQAVQLFNLPMAAALSLTQIIINLLLMWVHARLTERSSVSFFDKAVATRQNVKTGRAMKVLIGFNLVFIVVILLTPMVALLLRSVFGENGFTLGYYRALFNTGVDSLFFIEPFTAVFNSIGFALAAMITAVILAMLASLFLAGAGKSPSQNGKGGKSLWDAVMMLPLATSAVTLGFGYIVTLNRPPLNLRDSIFLVIIAHALVAFPFVIRCILPSLRKIPDNLRQAASVLGASPMQIWRQIDLPLISQALLTGAVFAFLISMGEFGASAFIVRPHTPTMPVAIFRFLGQPGEMNYGQAMAMSSLLMLVSCVSFYVIGKIGGTGIRSASSLNKGSL